MRFTPVEGDKTDNQEAKEYLLGGLVKPETDQERAKLGYDEAAGDGAAIASAPTGERRSADNHCSDRGEKIGGADCRIGRAAEIRRAECP